MSLYAPLAVAISKSAHKYGLDFNNFLYIKVKARVKSVITCVISMLLCSYCYCQSLVQWVRVVAPPLVQDSPAATGSDEPKTQLSEGGKSTAASSCPSSASTPMQLCSSLGSRTSVRRRKTVAIPYELRGIAVSMSFP